MGLFSLLGHRASEMRRRANIEQLEGGRGGGGVTVDAKSVRCALSV